MFEIKKQDADKQFIFGWANVAINKEGEQLVDWHGDMIDPEELENAAYEHVLEFRETGERHDPALRSKGRLIESIMFTKEKMEAMGIPEGTLPQAWWVGYKIDDPETWDKIKKGEYRMFSIDGTGKREAVEKADEEQKPMLFNDLVEKFNPYHDNLGRFASAGGGAAVSSGGATETVKMFVPSEREEAKMYAEQDYKRYDFTEDEVDAIATYTSAAFREINESLRMGGDGYDEEDRETIEALTQACNKASIQEPIKVYRGLKGEALDNFLEMAEADDLEEMVGSEIYDAGFWSTTLVPDIAQRFSGGAILEIELPKGAKGLMPNGNSEVSYECEVILQRNTTTRITGVRSEGDYTYIQGEYVM